MAGKLGVLASIGRRVVCTDVDGRTFWREADRCCDVGSENTYLRIACRDLRVVLAYHACRKLEISLVVRRLVASAKVSVAFKQREYSLFHRRPLCIKCTILASESMW